jgi:hypothetical protein
MSRLTDFEHRVLLDALDLLRRLNITVVKPDHRGGVLVTRGCGRYAVEGYADTIGDAIERALDA